MVTAFGLKLEVFTAVTSDPGTVDSHEEYQISVFHILNFKMFEQNLFLQWRFQIANMQVMLSHFRALSMIIFLLSIVEIKPLKHSIFFRFSPTPAIVWTLTEVLSGDKEEEDSFCFLQSLRKGTMLKNVLRNSVLVCPFHCFQSYGFCSSLCSR